ncbi:MAG: serine/threonine protein kinase [Frankiales bacterium]|nr:serine/threonine protein kinase [Frankiales bacterium]
MKTLVGGRYELDEVIGRGGMAEVLHGTDVRLGRDVAVKVLREELARDPSFQARFRREAQAAASLDAPSIVAVYDTGEDERGVPWIVMEYLDGRTLRDILTTEGRLLPQRALEVAADVCSALDVAHAAGIVHRDIKPANVMLTSRGEVKVMDFGIARAAAGNESTMTQTAAVIGTAAYLSPEQARGEHVDARSDIYSAGCLLYELVTGAPPFIGDSPVAVAYQHVREDPVPPSEYDPSLTPAAAANLDAVVLKAMAKNPANRYQSADEMREDLLRAVAGEPVLATPVLRDETAAVRAARPERSKALVYTLFGLLLLLVAAGSALLVHALLGSGTNLIKPPAVVGLSQQDATQQLSATGLQVGKITAVFDAKPVGTVLVQSPDKNFFVRKGGTVDLTVSRGIEMTTVPAVISLSQQEAEADLAAAKLITKVIPRDGNFPTGQVLDVIPRPQTQLPVHSTVTIVVASGNVQVPDVRNLTKDAAVAKLNQAGFGVGIRNVASAAAPNTVLQQTPVNVLAPRGTDVVIDVAQRPSPNPSGSATPSSTPSP